MADNRSLDEFLGAEESDEAEREAPESTAEPEPPTAESDAADEPDHDPATADSDPDVDTSPGATDEPVEPMAETFAWSADGGACARCGEAVEERWRDGDALVCGDCKAW